MNFFTAHTFTIAQTITFPTGVVFPYHVQTNVSVRRGIIWGISLHSIHMEEVFIIIIGNVYI